MVDLTDDGHETLSRSGNGATQPVRRARRPQTCGRPAADRAIPPFFTSSYWSGPAPALARAPGRRVQLSFSSGSCGAVGMVDSVIAGISAVSAASAAFVALVALTAEVVFTL